MADEHNHAHPHSHPFGPAARPAGAGTPAPITDPAQESLVRALRASFNVLRIVMLVLVVLYVLSGVFVVGPGNQGLIARFGKLRTQTDDQGGETAVLKPGSHFALPDPFERKYLVPGQVQTLGVTTFVFAHPKRETIRDLAEAILESAHELTPGVDGAMLTGDRNLSHGRWEVHYQIDDAQLFLVNVGETARSFEPLLQRLTETAVVREVAGRTIEQVTRTALDDVRAGVRRRIQASLDELKTGVRLVQVVASTIEPAAVRAEFNRVLEKENEKLRKQMEGEREATQILSRAAGSRHAELLALIDDYGAAQLRGAPPEELARKRADVDRLLDRAKQEGAGQVAARLNAAYAQADRINQTLRGEYEQFTKYLEQRRAQPGVTELGLWAAVRREILGNTLNEIFTVPSTGELEVHVKSDAQRRRELEEEQARKRLYPNEPSAPALPPSYSGPTGRMR